MTLGVESLGVLALGELESSLDTTAPVLTSPTGAKTGSTTASGTVTSDEAGIVRRYTSTSLTSPSIADHKSGSGAVAFLGQAMTAGIQAMAGITGLTASTTYYNHYLGSDAAPNDSAQVVSASFTTDAAGGAGLRSPIYGAMKGRFRGVI